MKTKMYKITWKNECGFIGFIWSKRGELKDTIDDILNEHKKITNIEFN